MTNILLINVINEDRKLGVENVCSSLGTAYIASYARKYGQYNDLSIIDIGQSFDKSIVGKYQPDVIGISSVTQNINIVKEISSKIKKIKRRNPLFSDK